jgi:hypothetical protein
MSKENYDQIISEVYNRYYYHKDTFGPLTMAQFVEEIKTNNEFAERWGLKMVERELSLEERVEYFNSKMISEGIRTQIATVDVGESYWKKSLEETNHNIPIKVIAISYNNEKTEIYE